MEPPFLWDCPLKLDLRNAISRHLEGLKFRKTSGAVPLDPQLLHRDLITMASPITNGNAFFFFLRRFRLFSNATITKVAAARDLSILKTGAKCWKIFLDQLAKMKEYRRMCQYCTILYNTILPVYFRSEYWTVLYNVLKHRTILNNKNCTILYN